MDFWAFFCYYQTKGYGYLAYVGNYGDHEMKTNVKLSKQRHQVKSRWYYIFWGSATLSVFVGQLYVGSGYHGRCQNHLTEC